MEFEAVIGLEVHVELHTAGKLFCRCANAFGQAPNSQVCPVCLGLPGVLPVINRKAVEYLVKVAHALNCAIAEISKFDRKNYFYPDMPKNYQISQYDLPLAQHGVLTIITENGKKDIRIRRIHLEEDTGKSTHKGAIDQSLYTLEDYNRAGVPLLEIVTEPDMGTPEEASLYLTELRRLVKWLEVSDCKMEEGSLRCDANVSLSSRKGTLGTKTEIKNMNSFKSVRDALDFEIKRQRDLLSAGGTISQETRGWDEKKSITIPMRSKEAEHDYRYFPDPDLMPLRLERAWIEALRAGLPELPAARKNRFVSTFSIPDYDAEFLTSSREMADFFETTVSHGALPKTVSNWLMGDISRCLNEKGLTLEASHITPAYLARMLALIEKGVINGKIGKDLIGEIIESGTDPDTIVKEKGWFQISDENELKTTVREIITANQEAASSYSKGNEKALGFLVGQIMKATRGKANPELLQKLLRQEMSADH